MLRHSVKPFVTSALCIIIILAVINLSTPRDAYAATVTLQIRLTAASGSDTMETAGVSATVSGTGCTGTLTHDGNPALQTFTCDASTTITVTYPTDTATSRFRDAAGASSFQFTSCAAGTCSEESKTMYRQFDKDLILTGIDTVATTRVALGSSAIIPISEGEDYLLKFDGTLEYAQAANNGVFSISTEDFSVYGFFKRDSDSGATQRLFAKQNPTGTGYNGGINSSDQFYCQIRSTNFATVVITTTTVQLDRWYAFGCSADRDSIGYGWIYDITAATLYENSADYSGQATGITNTSTFTLARASHTSDTFCNCQYNNLNFAIGTAISQTQFLQFAKTGTIVGFTPTSAYYFNDGSGNTANDEIASNDLTLTQSPTWEKTLWFDQGSTDITFENPLIITTDAERFKTTDSTSASTSDANDVSLTYRHQWNPDITATSISASVTSVTVTRTVDDSQGTEDIAGGTASGVWVDDNTLLSVEDPVSISATERWDTTGTVSWTITDATAKATGTYYQQYKQTVTLSGLDVAQSVSVTRTQTNSAGSTNVSGGSATEIWADSNTAFDIPLQKVITADQERFQSYDNSASASYTVSSANTKTFTYQHEFNTLFRVNEDHLGVIFAPMPTATFTSTVTTANSTILSLTYDTQVTDDYMEPADGRIWVKNGTQTFGAITWRGIDVRSAGTTCSVTSYGECDTESYSVHLGYGPPYHHFRIGTDDQTAKIDNTDFSDDEARLTFNATSSGSKTTIVEFLNGDYGGVGRVTIDGMDYDSANWSVTTIDSLTNLLRINNVPFSEHAFTVYFSASGTGSGGSGGGGGGGGGTTSGGPVVVLPQPGSFPLGLDVSVPPFSVQPGQSQTQLITIKWEGATKIIVQSIEFSSDAHLFSLDRSLPFAVILTGNENIAQVPLKVTLPETEQGLAKTVQMKVTAIAGGSTAAQQVPVMINLVPTNEFALYGGLAAVAGVVGIAVIRRKR